MQGGMNVQPRAREVPLGALQSHRVGHRGSASICTLIQLALQMLGADLGSDLELEELS